MIYHLPSCAQNNTTCDTSKAMSHITHTSSMPCLKKFYIKMIIADKSSTTMTRNISQSFFVNQILSQFIAHDHRTSNYFYYIDSISEMIIMPMRQNDCLDIFAYHIFKSHITLWIA